jgi:hypothetical protein
MNWEVVIKILKTNQLKAAAKFLVPEWEIYLTPA